MVNIEKMMEQKHLLPEAISFQGRKKKKNYTLGDIHRKDVVTCAVRWYASLKPMTEEASVQNI